MDDFVTRTVEDIAKRHREQVERAYHLGILHGINVQSMAQAKNSVMSFEDYGWQRETDNRVPETVSDTAETNNTHDNE